METSARDKPIGVCKSGADEIGSVVLEARDGTHREISGRIVIDATELGDIHIDVPTVPFQIPLSTLIPVRMENLLPAAKNIGTTHITNGCYRLHPVEWNIGEAAETLAAFCVQQSLTPRQAHGDAAKREQFRDCLRKRGVELEWPATKLDREEGDPHAHAGR